MSPRSRGAPRRGAPGGDRQGHAGRQDPACVPIHTEGVLDVHVQVVDRCGSGSNARDRAGTDRVVDRQTHPEGGPLIEEGLLEAEGITIRLHPVEGNLEPLVHGLVDVIEEVESEREAIDRHRRLVVGELELTDARDDGRRLESRRSDLPDRGLRRERGTERRDVAEHVQGRVCSAPCRPAPRRPTPPGRRPAPAPPAPAPRRRPHPPRSRRGRSAASREPLHRSVPGHGRQRGHCRGTWRAPLTPLTGLG